MRSHNGEAPTAQTVEASDLSVTLCKETNMKSIANTQLQFHNTNFAYMEMAGQKWLTATEVGQALEYADDKAIQRIFNRHSDEFTQQMTGVVKLTTPGGMQDVRMFSLRGAHLIAMFARTPKAKEFRRWVLDILDQECGQSPVARQFTDDELCDLAWVWKAGTVMLEACSEVHPLLEVAGHRLASHYCSIGQEYGRTLKRGQEILSRETKHIEVRSIQTWVDENWRRVLPHLRNEGIH